MTPGSDTTLANADEQLLVGERTRAAASGEEIRLTPSGRLCWESAAAEGPRVAPPPLAGTFRADWREGLFVLSAEKIDTGSSPTLRFWQRLADRYLTALCHVPGSAGTVAVDPPSPAEHATWILTAPPMRGGEYLSEPVLEGIWDALVGWGAEAMQSSRGLETFLSTRAPKWHQVGRVCFHLAENRNDPDRPFAFMATYATGFGSGGRLTHVPLGKALEQYADKKDRPKLLKLLIPVQEAAERCGWVRELVDSKGVFRPSAWSAERAYEFLKTAPLLEDCGLAVRLPNWWKKRARPGVSVTIGETKRSNLGVEAMLDFDVDVALGDQSITAEELDALLAGEDGLVLFKGQWIEVDRERLREAIDHWQDLREKARQGEISFIEGMRLLAGAPADLRHDEGSEDERRWIHISAGRALREVLDRLREPGQLAAVNAAEHVRATLRPYQRDGLAWLHFLTELGLGACLADDMGLGKTLQVLALLAAAKTADGGRPPRPSLLVIPASILGNWRHEAERFTPGLRLTFLHPAETDTKTIEKIAAAPAKHLAAADLAVTTYSMLTRQEWLTGVDWRLVILDEAQAIKNASTRQSRAAKKLRAGARIALTGTPVENRLGDLWSLFDFLNPGLLGSARVFKSFVKDLQSREHDQFAPLRRLVGPYILRRMKTDRSIIADLPEKTETVQYCSLTRSQVKLYRQAVKSMATALAGADGMARRGLVLQTLMRLKQICNHPSQLTGDGDYDPADSGKFARIGGICEELAARQARALIFTQFREIIDPLMAFLAGVFGRPGLSLHGQTTVKRRRGIVEQFQDDDGPPFFVLSLKAGGTGLNLTAASHVIHFDRWWNPAVEDQATDRAFRIGQRRNVLVHKFITRGTIEERIDEMIAEKRQLADGILAGGSEINVTELSDDELLDLVRLDVTRAAP